MFAKQFNNISPRHLLNAFVVIFAISFSYWLYPSKATIWYPVADWAWPALNELFTFIVFNILALGISLLFAEALNRRHVFEGHYLHFLIAGVLFWIWLYPLNSGPELWSIFLFAFLIFYLLPILEPKAASAGRNFGSAFVIAWAGFIYGDALFLLLLPIGLNLAMRSLNGRSLLALILGYGAALYFAFTADYLFDMELMAVWKSQVASIEFFEFRKDYQRLVHLVILGLFLSISVLINLSQGNYFNNGQRQQINFWVYITGLGAAGFLLFDNANFWLGLILLPTASLGALAIRQVKNRWLRDALLLLPFLAYLSFFFFP